MKEQTTAVADKGQKSLVVVRIVTEQEEHWFDGHLGQPHPLGAGRPIHLLRKAQGLDAVESTPRTLGQFDADSKCAAGHTSRGMSP
jgi:hypothetical protein